ncbi:hypothetical protein [Streptomyces zaomyceticus]|uniref:hypothetical protein n=1 Tax=Streptomyces zaomyceticus TaxID=68286 RepID=UPI002E226F1E
MREQHVERLGLLAVTLGFDLPLDVYTGGPSKSVAGLLEVFVAASLDVGVADGVRVQGFDCRISGGS